MKIININVKSIKRIILAILIIINCITIFNFSSQQAEKSSNTSGKVVDVVMQKIYKKANISKQEEMSLRDKITTVVRKSAHFSIYTCLGILSFLFVNTYDISKKKKILFTICFCLIYACSDEFHQLFVSGRSGEIRDVCIDTCGATFGTLIVIGVTKVKNEIIKFANKNDRTLKK